MEQIWIYLEIGKERTFAGAIQWPGWCRSGRDESAALMALLDYGPRYAGVLQSAQIDFQPPAESAAFAVLERIEGDATTDFGAPGKAISSDIQPIDDAVLQHFHNILEASWHAFDAAAKIAAGRQLRKGPRGGGRDLDKIVQHVLDADASYLSRLGQKLKVDEGATIAQGIQQTRQTIKLALANSKAGGMPEQGPRGGMRWTARQFVRRVVWHVLDHAWELEDRITTT